MRDWRAIRLDEVATVTVGHVGPMVDKYRPEGVPFLRSQNVRAHKLDFKDIKFIDDDFHRVLKKSALRPGDVVTVRTGSPGTTAVVPAAVPVANCSDLVIIRPGPDLNSRWLSYYLNWVTKSHISRHLVGAVQQHFNVGSARRLEIILPSLAEQQAIGDVLGALDAKVATNADIVGAEDALARVRYRALTAQEGDLRPLSTLASFVNGKAFTKDASGSGRVVIRIAELNSGLGDSTVYNDIEAADQYLARPGDLLFAWSGSLTVRRWFRPEAIVNQHIFKVIPTGVPLWVVNGSLREKLADFIGIAADKATTMGHIQRHHLDDVVVVPNAKVIAEHDRLMSALWNRALQAEQESLLLIELRDTLLPELMSGRMRVKDAEHTVGELV